MRFISDIINERRRAAPVVTPDQERADAGEPQADPLAPEAWCYPQEQPMEPLPLDAYALARQDSVEEDEQEADAVLFDQPEDEFADEAADQSEDQDEEFFLAQQEDAPGLDARQLFGAESDEDDGPEAESFEDSVLKAFSDPFERLAKDRVQQSVASVDPLSMEGDGDTGPDVGLVVVGRAPQSNFAEHLNMREPAPIAVPAPTLGRGANRSGRVKTRLLGFSTGALEQTDVFDETRSVTGNPFPVGWLVVVSELGRGACFALQDGVSKVGRGTDQTVCLNFGDNSISRDNHLSIAYDAEQNKFYIGHSGKSNLVRLNNKPLLSTEELVSRDQIRLGETTLRFIALCENDFTWQTPDEKARKHA